MFLPSVMRPLAVGGAASSGQTPDRCATSPLTVMRGPPGSYVAERLASTLAGWDRWHSSVWLRPQDLRPAALEASLATACGHRWSSGAIDAPGMAAGTGSGTGPGTDVADMLTHALDGAPPGATIVIDLGSRPDRSSLRMLEGLHPALTRHGVALIAVTESRFWPTGRRWSGTAVRTEALIDPGGSRRLPACPACSGGSWSSWPATVLPCCTT